MPKAMKQARGATPVYTPTPASAPKYSELCQRVLNYTPEQFVADVDSGVKPKLLSEEENALLTPLEHAAIINHVAELLDGFFKIKGWTDPENEPANY